MRPKAHNYSPSVGRWAAPSPTPLARAVPVSRGKTTKFPVSLPAFRSQFRSLSPPSDPTRRPPSRLAVFPPVFCSRPWHLRSPPHPMARFLRRAAANPDLMRPSYLVMCSFRIGSGHGRWFRRSGTRSTVEARRATTWKGRLLIGQQGDFGIHDAFPCVSFRRGLDLDHRIDVRGAVCLVKLWIVT